MATFRRMRCNDLFNFNNVNFDNLTETYSLNFYMQYMALWPELCIVAESPQNEIMGYIFGKAEGKDKEWHGHVTAVTIAPEYRRLGLAKRFMAILEYITENVYNGYFVDLFVRSSNKTAIQMYINMGYIVYRTVVKYYDKKEDGLDMRKAMRRDVNKESMIPYGRNIEPEELEFD